MVKSLDPTSEKLKWAGKEGCGDGRINGLEQGHLPHLQPLWPARGKIKKTNR